MMKLPTTLKVGSVVYDVRVGQDEVYLAENGAVGHIEHTARLIRITSKAPIAEQAAILFHEVLHAAARHTALDQEWGDRQEAYVDRLQQALQMVLSDNPGLTRLLLPEGEAG